MGNNITITINLGGCIEPKIINTKIASWIEFLNNDTEVHKLSNKYGDITTGDLELGDSYRKNFSFTGEYIMTDKYNTDIVAEIYAGKEFWK